MACSLRKENFSLECPDDSIFDVELDICNKIKFATIVDGAVLLDLIDGFWHVHACV